MDKVATSLLLLCDPPQTWEDAALCDRLDYLEARCIGTNAYRKTLQEGTD